MILLFVIAVVAAGYVYQIQLQKLRRQEQALDLAQRELGRRQAEVEKMLAEVAEKRKTAAGDIIAIAGEYRLLALGQSRDVTRGEASLRQAKELFAQEKYDEAFDLTRQSIGELKTAPLKKKAVSLKQRKKMFYKVRKNDSLWSIAKKSPLKSGQKWGKIWRANKKKIHDPDLIYPRQVLVIPINSSK